jgi:transposase
VPHRLVRETVEVRATTSTIEVFHTGRRVASHVRAYGRQQFITDPAHMPAAHRAHREWTPSRLLTWGASVAPPVGAVVQTILADRPHPEHGYRACLGLMRLQRRYGPDRLTAACQRALATGSTSYRGVEAILRHGLDRVPLAPPAPAPLSLPHANLRGPAYYQQLRLEA